MENQGNNLEEIKQAAYDGAKAGAKRNFLFSGGAGLLSRILKLAVILVFILVVIPFATSTINPFSRIMDSVSTFLDQATTRDVAENHDMVLEDNGLLGFTAADFGEVILGDSSKLKKLEVYTQELSEMVTYTKAGFGGLDLFKKTKNYTYTGTATYIVDLSKLSKDSIELDEDEMTVILYIPHTELPDQNLNVPQENVVVGDTEKGMLSLGDLNASDEDCNALMKEAKEKMKTKLEEDDVQATADKVAEMMVWEMYQPMISQFAAGYTLKIEFTD